MGQQNIIFLTVFVVFICVNKSYQDNYTPLFALTEEILGAVLDPSCNYLSSEKKLTCYKVTADTFLENINKIKDELIQLDCDNCAISGLPFTDQYFSNTLKKVESISLSNIQLYDGQNFTLFESVKRITLVNCHLNIFDRKLYPTNQLTFLKLCRNKFQLIPEITGFDKLAALNLSNNGINEIDVNAFKNLKNLKYLDLSYNNLKTLPDKLFEFSSTILLLKLDHNRLFSISEELFKGLTHLTTLDISYNPIFDVRYEYMFHYQLKTARIYYLNGLPCSTLKHRLMNYINSEYHQAVDKDDQLNFIKFICKVTDNMYYGRLNFSIFLDSTKRQWYEGDYEGIKCIDYFNPNWASKGYIQWKDKSIVEQIKEIKHIKDKLKSKNIFSIEACGLNTVLNELETVYNHVQES